MSDYYDEYREPPIQCPKEELKVGKVVRENIPTNKQCRIYHVRFKLYDAKTKCQIWEAGDFESAPEFRETNSTMQFIVEKIPLGIQSIFCRDAYELWITKGGAFDWEEIEPRIFEILNQMTP